MLNGGTLDIEVKQNGDSSGGSNHKKKKSNSAMKDKLLKLREGIGDGFHPKQTNTFITVECYKLWKAFFNSTGNYLPERGTQLIL